jgi:2-phosphosulfolactate phosphatase
MGLESPFDQHGFDVALEWGEAGLATLAPGCDAIVIVDVLSFSTCVEAAVSRGARVVPCARRVDAPELAARHGAEVARPRGEGGPSLSPLSLLPLPRGATIVLPSPNGSSLSLATGDVPTLAGCLRNATAVARAATALGRRIGVIAAGERWRGDGSLRPAIEDLLGAGAVVAALPGRRSPEAEVACAAFAAMRLRLPEVLLECASGRELCERGFAGDVLYAAVCDVSEAVPLLQAGVYRPWSGAR